MSTTYYLITGLQVGPGLGAGFGKLDFNEFKSIIDLIPSMDIEFLNENTDLQKFTILNDRNLGTCLHIDHNEAKTEIYGFTRYGFQNNTEEMVDKIQWIIDLFMSTVDMILPEDHKLVQEAFENELGDVEDE